LVRASPWVDQAVQFIAATSSVAHQGDVAEVQDVAESWSGFVGRTKGRDLVEDRSVVDEMRAAVPVLMVVNLHPPQQQVSSPLAMTFSPEPNARVSGSVHEMVWLAEDWPRSKKTRAIGTSTSS
jgi:hypothetical protein